MATQEASSPLTFAAFLDKMKEPAAADLVRSIKTFIKKFEDRDSTFQPDVEADSETVQQFFLQSEQAFRTHPAWHGCGPEVLELAVEGLEKYVMSKIWRQTFSKSREDKDRDERYARLATALSFVDLATLAGTAAVPDATLMNTAQTELLKMDRYKAPRDKLLCLVNVKTLVEEVVTVAARNGAGFGGADAFFPVFLLVIIKARPPKLASNIEYVRRFRSRPRLNGQFDFMLANLESAAMYLDTVDYQHLHITHDEFLSHLAQAGIPEAEMELQQRQQQQRDNDPNQEELEQQESEVKGVIGGGVRGGDRDDISPLIETSSDVLASTNDLAVIAATAEAEQKQDEPQPDLLTSTTSISTAAVDTLAATTTPTSTEPVVAEEEKEITPATEQPSLTSLPQDIPIPSNASPSHSSSSAFTTPTKPPVQSSSTAEEEAVNDGLNFVGGLTPIIGAAASPQVLTFQHPPSPSPPPPTGSDTTATTAVLAPSSTVDVHPQQQPEGLSILLANEHDNNTNGSYDDISDSGLINTLIESGIGLVLEEEQQGRLQTRHPYIYAHADDLSVGDVKSVLALYRRVVLRYEALVQTLRQQQFPSEEKMSNTGNATSTAAGNYNEEEVVAALTTDSQLLPPQNDGETPVEQREKEVVEKKGSVNLISMAESSENLEAEALKGEGQTAEEKLRLPANEDLLDS